MDIYTYMIYVWFLPYFDNGSGITWYFKEKDKHMQREQGGESGILKAHDSNSLWK